LRDTAVGNKGASAGFQGFLHEDGEIGWADSQTTGGVLADIASPPLKVGGDVGNI
jgi:hypothetical protein